MELPFPSPFFMSLQLDTFQDELNRRCSWGARSDEYRVRWVPSTETYDIEQKVSRGSMDIPPAVKRRSYEEFERLRDGYALVARTSPARFFKCKQCTTRLTASEGQWKEVDCKTCRNSRVYNNVQYFVAYWPLSESLLTHLESSHPSRLNERMKEIEEMNERNKASHERDWNNHLEAGLLDHRYHIAGTPRTSNKTNSIW